LARAGRDASIQATTVKLISDLLINLTILLKTLDLALDGVASLGLFTCFIRFFNLLLVQLDVVLLEVPLSEGSGIDENNGVLHEGLGSHQLVIRRVVDGIKYTSLGRRTLGAPREATMVNPESTALDLATSAANIDGLLGTELGHSRHSSHFELSLFLVDWHAATRGSPLVPRVPRNTHTS